ncbi:hypothetical protein BJV74DRAFT_375209 [Russula compacta]|nr:hypothetical protein BJV74DRAFT_375209 [Russula compacta]
MTDTQLSLFKIDNDISLLQNRLLTLPQLHPLRSECLSTLARARFTRYKFSDESEDLDKSVSHSTEAILLPFDTIQLGSYIIESLFLLAIAFLLRSQELKRPSDVKHAIKYLCHLQDSSLETSSVTCNQIKAHLVWALAIQVDLESVDPMRDIGEMATLCLELLTSGVSESLLIHAVELLASAICMTPVPFGQPPSDGIIECLREARIDYLIWMQFPSRLPLLFLIASSGG